MVGSLASRPATTFLIDVADARADQEADFRKALDLLFQELVVGGGSAKPLRQDVLEDLSDLEIYQALLSPTGIRGLVIECEDCHEPHYFDWDLLRGTLRHLLDSGRPNTVRK